ncbi:MAG: hypothetical protein ACRDGD_03070 [Candidatus Limnocylindria bacterium]
MRTALAARAAVAALVVVATACVTDNRPDDAACSAPSVELAVTVTVDSMTPNDPAVCREQEVTLTVSSEVDGVLHIHGYDDAVPATPVSDDEETILEFTADRSGQFPVEMHANDDPEGVNIGIFTVHEP